MRLQEGLDEELVTPCLGIRCAGQQDTHFGEDAGNEVCGSDVERGVPDVQILHHHTLPLRVGDLCAVEYMHMYTRVCERRKREKAAQREREREKKAAQ